MAARRYEISLQVDRKVKRTSRNIWNFRISRRRDWQNVWNVFHFSLLIGCCSYLLLGGFCHRLSVLYDLAEHHYPVAFAQVFISRRALFWGNSPALHMSFRKLFRFFTPITCALNHCPWTEDLTFRYNRASGFIMDLGCFSLYSLYTFLVSQA